ncbi:hypothetical protein E2C01_017583 [Portunus trituberculatus]|uniref:Uncharacterized protein n=1 Tax=Portunus trituberculatus TaxID=210409 RepID=A0A5B7DSC1_PORTR|nr:hypothetical protein [Portunus trituberculatus]
MTGNSRKSRMGFEKRQPFSSPNYQRNTSSISLILHLFLPSKGTVIRSAGSLYDLQKGLFPPLPSSRTSLGTTSTDFQVLTSLECNFMIERAMT